MIFVSIIEGRGEIGMILVPSAPHKTTCLLNNFLVFITLNIEAGNLQDGKVASPHKLKFNGSEDAFSKSDRYESEENSAPKSSASWKRLTKPHWGAKVPHLPGHDHEAVLYLSRFTSSEESSS